MAVFKCKMCGGELQIAEGMTVCECAYCGTTQTLPKLNTDKRENLYDRANHFRRNNDYDKAMTIYEQILNEDSSDAEAYWSLVLCRYGIEYVEDPTTHKRVPTVNRAQYKSIFADEDYKSALSYADAMQRSVYEEEAKTIDEIQKGILEISKKEEPFDVFICYKESDEFGQRTRDSVIANDLYHQLTKEGYKTFFAAITLEDKLGKAYEPYIFAALNSAKVMIVIGTKPEYFVAPWVKNEWSRFLTIIKNDSSKMLIPAYRDMDPYELPEEFSFLQAQDMSKIGFVNDIIHGIKKVIKKEDNTTVRATNKTGTGSIGTNTDSDTLLKRAFLFIEGGNWENATIYCDKVLDIDPNNAYAYLGKLLSEKKYKKQSDLSKTTEVLSKNTLFKNAYKYGDDNLRKELDQYVNDSINNLITSTRAKESTATTEEEYLQLINILKENSGFEVVDNYLAELSQKYNAIHTENEYINACNRMNSARTELDFHEAYLSFKKLSGYKDSEELMAKCAEQEDSFSSQNGMCAICRTTYGAINFIPHNTIVKCCNNCFSRLSALQNSLGQDNQMARNSYTYLNNAISQTMTHSAAITRVQSILEKYRESVPGVFENQEDTTSKIVEEITESAEVSAVNINKEYEYDIQIVIDKPSGGVDNEMLKFVIDKYSNDGWKLQTMMRDMSEAGGQVVVIFERKYNKK